MRDPKNSHLFRCSLLPYHVSKPTGP